MAQGTIPTLLRIRKHTAAREDGDKMFHIAWFHDKYCSKDCESGIDLSQKS